MGLCFPDRALKRGAFGVPRFFQTWWRSLGYGVSVSAAGAGLSRDIIAGTLVLGASQAFKWRQRVGSLYPTGTLRRSGRNYTRFFLPTSGRARASGCTAFVPFGS